MKVMKKCPPGVLCIENMTFGLIVVSLFFILYFIYVHLKPSSSPSQVNNHISIHDSEVIRNSSDSSRGRGGGGIGGGVGGGWFSGFGILPSYPYTNLPNDVLQDPYAPPLSDERYFLGGQGVGLGVGLGLAPIPIARGRMPINVPTNVGAVDTHYRQVGILTPLNSKGKILPLMGRPVFVNRDKWQYYTMTDKSNSIKLPISRNGRSCTNEYGCDKLYNGDSVYVEGYGEAFKVTIYDDDTIRYIPFV